MFHFPQLCQNRTVPLPVSLSVIFTLPNHATAHAERKETLFGKRRGGIQNILEFGPRSSDRESPLLAHDDTVAQEIISCDSWVLQRQPRYARYGDIPTHTS